MPFILSQHGNDATSQALTTLTTLYRWYTHRLTQNAKSLWWWLIPILHLKLRVVHWWVAPSLLFFGGICYEICLHLLVINSYQTVHVEGDTYNELIKVDLLQWWKLQSLKGVLAGWRLGSFKNSWSLDFLRVSNHVTPKFEKHNWCHGCHRFTPIQTRDFPTIPKSPSQDCW